MGRKRTILNLSHIGGRVGHVLAEFDSDIIRERTGLKYDKVSRIINGWQQPKADTLARIVRLTGCDAHWLLTGEGRAFNPVLPTETPATPEPSAQSA